MLRKNVSFIVSGSLTAFRSNETATVNATDGGDGTGILCHGVFFDYDATVNAEIETIDGIRYENGNAD